MHHFIAQASTTASPQSVTPPPLIEGTLIAAIVMFLLKEGVSFFKKKDEDEAKLTSELIQDLRLVNREQLQHHSQVLGELRASHHEIAKAVEQISKAVADINVNYLQTLSNTSELLTLLREQGKELAILSEKINSVQNRHTAHEQFATNGKNV